jgi:predicted nucleic acid-binding protein
MKYVVDTNIFNRLADGVDVLGRLPSDAQLIAAHIQIDEINSTRDKERRARLFLAFAHIKPTLLPTETAVWDVSRWNEAKWDEGSYFNAIKVALDLSNRSKSNNREDALIAEVALVNGYGFVTADRDLANVVQAHGGNVVLIVP